jgi:type II secretory ATPase GspE/PulE/Tfp pilus assembly ATPase PilB-like protein
MPSAPDIIADRGLNEGLGLIDYLLKHGLLSEDQNKIVSFELSRSTEPVANLLTRLGFISEATLRDAMSESLGQKSVDLSNLTVDAEALSMVSREMAARHTLLPLAWDSQTNTLTLAIADPSDLLALDKLSQVLPEAAQLNMRLASASDINKSIDQAYGYKLDIDGILKEIETGKVDLASLEGNSHFSQPTVRLIDAIVTDAVKHDASDIHFEPEGDFLRIRYRIDGVLRQVRVLHKSYWSAMVVRIKVVSHMNIAEIRSPQDGHMTMTVRGHSVDFRVSALPTVHGENIVMRILDRYNRDLKLEDLGATDSQIALMQRLMNRPEGIIVVTGPTGSGKTTTLYAMLQAINNESINIMTLEDPVEYPLPMVRQTSLNESAKLDYADGIRAMLRQDPDVILVGEIRDSETATMSFRAAMTGHQVYTTLHTNSAIGIFPRLIDMGISTQVLTGNIIGIVAQRLVRLLCPHCKTPTTLPEHLLRLLPHNLQATPFAAQGCEKCNFTGYRGRHALFEILPISENIDAAIANNANAIAVRKLALAEGFIPLAYSGLEKIALGFTTLEEVARNTDLTYLDQASPA